MNQESPNVSVMEKAGLGEQILFSFWLCCLQNVSQFRFTVLIVGLQIVFSQRRDPCQCLIFNTICFNVAVQAFLQICTKDCPCLFESQKAAEQFIQTILMNNKIKILPTSREQVWKS